MEALGELLLAIPEHVSKAFNEVMERLGLPKTIVLDLALGFNTLLLFALFVIACVMSGTVKTYTSPAAVGDGLDVLWSVDQGDAFAIIVPPLCIMLCNVVGLVMINLQVCNGYRWGVFIGISIAFTCSLLQYLVEWGGQAVMLRDMAKDTDISLNIGFPLGSGTIVKKSAIETATALTVISAILLVLQIAQTFFLMLMKDAVTNGEPPCGATRQGSSDFAQMGGSTFAASGTDDDL